MSTLYGGLRAMVPAFLLLACGTTDPGAKGSQGPAGPAVQQRDTTVVDGPAKEYDINGRLQLEGNRKGGQRHGIWTSYFPDGQVRSRSEYRDGRLEGVATVFRANGGIYYTGQYRNDRQVGEWRFFNEQGNLERTVLYDTTGTVVPAPGDGR